MKLYYIQIIKLNNKQYYIIFNKIIKDKINKLFYFFIFIH